VFPLGVIIGRRHPHADVRARSSTRSTPFRRRLRAVLIVWFGLFLESARRVVFLMSVFDVLVLMIAGAARRAPLARRCRTRVGASHRQRLA